MFQYIIEGVLLGLTLTILIGPIFIALMQTGIQKGIRAGIAVGTGIWTSDLIVIIVGFLFIKPMHNIIHNGNFQFWMGSIGGLILIFFGIFQWVKKPVIDWKTKPFTAKTFAGYWTSGFMVNTINPFTFVFWLSVLTSHVVVKSTPNFELCLLFGSILLTIMITDSAKVVLAKSIRNKLNPVLMQKISWLAAILFIIFGAILIARVAIY